MQRENKIKILVTGAAGFVGKNLCTALLNIKENKDRTHPGPAVNEVFGYDIESDPALLDEYCAKADFVFNLAGVNRPKDNSEFIFLYRKRLPARFVCLLKR